jgi:predicted HicB family RNase H-like nuclease
MWTCRDYIPYHTMKRRRGTVKQAAAETVMVSARVPEDLHREAKKLAVEQGKSLQAVIAEALVRYTKQGRTARATS